jgi:hypothetical protein
MPDGLIHPTAWKMNSPKFATSKQHLCNTKLLKIVPKIVNLTMLLGPPDKSQISGAFYSAYERHPTVGCRNEEKENDS